MQQHGSKYFTHRPPTLGVGSTFLKYGHVAYKIKEQHSSKILSDPLPADPGQHGSKYFTHRPLPLTLRVGSKVQNSVFSEYGNVAYQIKWNHKYCNMVANILPADPPPRGSKGLNSIFLEYGHVAYRIEGNDSCSNMVSNPLP